jgi:beta-galactosidase
MRPISFTPTHYLIGETPIYLYSGEFHYFRVPKSDWRARMRLFKEAGGNCLATYIPWLLHEPEEGTFAFGETAAWLDLEGFLNTAREEGLYVIARPGPYQYSELVYAGLPGWLCENYPELLARNRQGEIFRRASVSYVHPLFLEKTRRWLDVVCPIIARHTVSRGGPVALVQFDNELVGIHEWFGSLDYHPVSMGFGHPDGRYPRFLRVRYGSDLNLLNRRYGTAYRGFDDVEPPESADPPDPAGILRMKDYFDFYLGTIAEYAGFLASAFRQSGIDTPLIHNSANPRMNAYFLETVEALQIDLGGVEELPNSMDSPPFLLGSDHYYNLGPNWPQNHPTPQYAARVFTSNEMLRLMGFPPTVLELPGGSCSNWPPVLAEDAYACYLTNLAFGMKGHNFYIFTGGPNPPGAGSTTDLYDYDASIGASGEVRPLYAVQKAFGRFIQEHRWLVEAAREYDCRFALDFEHARAHNYWKQRAGFLYSPTEAFEFLHTGALTSALCASLTPAFVDLRQDDWVPDPLTPLFVAAASSMGRAKQARLVRFLQGGGKALITPVLPGFDENLEPCTLLADFLGFPAGELVPNVGRSVRVSVAGVVNVLANGSLFFTRRLPDGAEVLGKDELSGQPLAWSVETPGGGRAVFLGMSWEHAMHEHRQMVAGLLEGLGLRRKVTCSNPNLWTSLWTAGDRSLLFVMNLFSAPLEAEIRVQPGARTHPVDLSPGKIPPVSVLPFEI